MEGHYIVCGLGRFGLRVVELLRAAAQPVVVITDQATRADRKKRAVELGAAIIEGDFRFADVLDSARVSTARALLLVASTENENLETALDVRRMAPHVRIVMRLTSDKIADRLCHDFAIDAVLSPSVLAAREFTKAALDTPPPRARPRGPVTDPDRRLRLRNGSGGRRAGAEPQIILFSLFLLFLAGVLLFQRELGLPLADAVYFTAAIVTTVGLGEYNLQNEPAWIKLFGALLMFSGITLIAVLAAFLTNYFLSGSAAQRRAERMAKGLRGHVILCGLGSVGFEVVEDLLERRARVVVVDQTPGDVYFTDLAARIPLIVGDATRPDTLVRAGIDRARALIAATSDDAINLEIGLTAQSVIEERRPDRPMRLILRCFDADLAGRIHAVSDAYTLLSATEISAPIFVARAMAPEK